MWKLANDFRAEALLAFWLENGEGRPEDVTIQPEGTFQRSYRKDVLQIEQRETPTGKRLTLHISREGLYDMLPEGLFHQAKIKTRENIREAVDESRRFKKEEKAARRLFLPLEQEYYRHRVWLEHTELKTWLHSVHPDNVSLFLDFWGIAKEVFTLQQSNFMLALLPHLHRIVGDWVLTTACLQIMLQEQVQLESFIAGKKAETEDLFSRLGGISLGVDAVLGDTWIDDQPAIKVKVGPVAMDRLLPFLPGGIRHQQLEIWYGYFFPAETEVSTELWIEADQASFRLLPEESFSRLGLTTII